MTSRLYVWIYLPGDLSPTLAARAEISERSSSPAGSLVYAKRYLENPRALPLDPVALPLREQEFETTLLGGHFSALLDAGPDSWGKRLIDRLQGAQTEYGYLLHLNGGQAGALAFSAAPEQEPEQRVSAIATASLEELCNAAELIEKGGRIDEHWAGILDAGSSAGGARPKFNLRHGERLWLAKLESVLEAGQPVNMPILEAGTLALARLCGVDTPEFELRQAGPRQVLLVERFDRVKQGDTWSRLRYVSARTVFYSNPELQRWSYTGSYGRLAKEMARWSRSPRQDMARLFRRMVFNCLVSNTDDHDLNHGLIGDAAGFELAPAFDLVPQRSATRRRLHKLLIGDEGALATRGNLLSVAQVFDLEAKEAAAIIDDMRLTVDHEWRACLQSHGADAGMIDAMAFTFDTGHIDGN